ncbi:MAG: DUF2202 domain-containing protein [Acidobacteria bacterium]|nr:DUF2202 domain-containing protein [Acidobacteriota bacterium]
MRTRGLVITFVAAGLVVVGVGAAAIVLTVPPAEAPRSQGTATVAPAPTATAVDSTPVTAASLSYMIEEEKLAHDVYVLLGETWGANIFGNIAASETTHQNLLVPLLASRGIVDSRSTELGVFTNTELQALYDRLIAQGRTSYREAIQVGVTIEKKDIVDLNGAIALEGQADVVSAYQRLLAGSQNHLAAFERQA